MKDLVCNGFELYVSGMNVQSIPYSNLSVVLDFLSQIKMELYKFNIVFANCHDIVVLKYFDANKLARKKNKQNTSSISLVSTEVFTVENSKPGNDTFLVYVIMFFLLYREIFRKIIRQGNVDTQSWPNDFEGYQTT